MLNRTIAVLDAPSNLGLRPPQPGVAPGAYKLGWAFREQGLPKRLGASDQGVVIPPRYLPDTDGRTTRNEMAIARYSQRLADRIQAIYGAGDFVLTLGGDCSILLGPMLALRRMGHYGLVFIDGHLDFRHPGNSPAIGAAAGEELALVTGRGGATLTNLEGLAPLVRETDVSAVGFRADDECAQEARQSGIHGFAIPDIVRIGPDALGRNVASDMRASEVAGYWIHLDVDVLDGNLMPAVDSPTPDGLTYAALTALLAPLLASPLAVGLDVTVFDPDLDEDQTLSRNVVDALVNAFNRA